MNYYPRYPAHYQTKTLHLTMEQDGAYTRLLDWYYANERPIPHVQRHAIARAMTPSERRSTDLVLGEFFVREGEQWSQDRCEAEIEKARPKIDAAKANGKKGGRPRKQPGGEAGGGKGTQEKPIGFPLGFENGTQDEPGAKPPQSPIPIVPPDTSLQAHQIAEGATAAGRACLLMRGAGCIQTNPSHPDLLAALAEGVTPETLAATVAEGLARTPPIAHPFSWAIATARSRHAAGAKPIHAGAGNEANPDNAADRRESTAERTRRFAEEGERAERAERAIAPGAHLLDVASHALGADG